VSKEALRKAAKLDKQADAHPVTACPDLAEHERWARRASDVEKRMRGLERRIRTRTETLGRQFDRVLAVLETLTYVKDFSLTERGELLRRIYGEGDILVTEGLAEGLFQGLTHAGMAALVSAMVYESRERTPRPADFPTADIRQRYHALQESWKRIRRTEEQNQVELCRELEPGFTSAAFHWAEGKPLEDVLASVEMAPGDFVRTCKMLNDLLGQIEAVAADEVSTLAREARAAVSRGVVAYTGL
jgi:ATP-dependent RNA helicase HelY